MIVYDGLMGVKRTFSRFKDKAYSGVFRSDGRLVAAGGEDGLVQVSPLHGVVQPCAWILKGHDLICFSFCFPGV